MKIVFENPPIIDEARNLLRLPPGAVFTFGDVLYNPSHAVLDEPLYKHEEHHSEQQGNDPQGWWIDYLKSSDFRLSQEIPAYQIQYQTARKYIKDRNRLNTYLISLAMDLSSPMYGSVMTFQDAYTAIRNERLYKFMV